MNSHAEPLTRRRGAVSPARPVGLPQMLVRAAFAHWLGRTVWTGALGVVLPDGQRISGGGAEAAREVTIRIRGWRTLFRLMWNPELALGEAYMDGGLVIEKGTIWAFLDLVGRNLAGRRPRPHGLLSKLRILVGQGNGRGAARRNAAHHYDLSLELYRRFLDDDLQYSCAYFERADASLEKAQAAKKRHITQKLLLKPGMRVLDIGCGWGGLGLSLAEDAGADVTGITLSREQLAVARARARDRGLGARAKFRLTDYRDVRGRFDRIVSVGMFEHVGRPNYQAYFDAIARLLQDRGVALVHAIGQKAPTGPTSPWIAKYIFPGGHIAALSEVLPCIERAGLWVTDIEILRLHYAETLKAWRARFAARRAEIAALYDERFCRMWEFYLCLSEIAFRYRGCMVFQIQLAKRVDAAPITRDYLNAAQAA